MSYGIRLQSGLLAGCLLGYLIMDVAWAQSPSATIVFCANPAGQARIVADAGDCRSNETVFVAASGASTGALESRVARLEGELAAFAPRISNLESLTATLGASVRALELDVLRLDDVLTKGLAGLRARLDGVDSTIDALDTKYTNGLNALQSQLDRRLDLVAAEVFRIDALIDTLQTSLSRIDAVLAGVSRRGSTLLLTGINLQLVNGSGSTDSTNGLGNLILGYNGGDPTILDRNGSHNLVIGDGHSYTAGASGGIVAGLFNTISGESTSILGGSLNVNNGIRSVIVSGNENEIPFGVPTVPFSSPSVILSGEGNSATEGGIVLSGNRNDADDAGAVVISGSFNSAAGGVIVDGVNNVIRSNGSAVILSGRGNELTDLGTTFPPGLGPVILAGDGVESDSATGPLRVYAWDTELWSTGELFVPGDAEISGDVSARSYLTLP